MPSGVPRLEYPEKEYSCWPSGLKITLDSQSPSPHRHGICNVVGIPQFHSAIVAGCGDPLAVGAKRYALNEIGMSPEDS